MHIPGRTAIVTLVALCLGLGACASRHAKSYQQAASPAGGLAVGAALEKVGSPYRFGGRGPSAFDCSGLVYFAYRSAGIELPRTSAAQLQATRPVPLGQARPGDLVFFRYGQNISHVGIYLGNQRFVHAPSSGRPVSEDSLADPHYRDRFVGAGRVQGKL